VARTGQGGEKSDSNPLAELAGTGQCGAGTDESRMTSGRTTKKENPHKMRGKWTERIVRGNSPEKWTDAEEKGKERKGKTGEHIHREYQKSHDMRHK